MSTAFAGTLPSTPASRYARCGDMRTLRYPPSRMPTNAYSTPGIKRREPRTRFWARHAWMTEHLLRDAAHSNATASPFSARAPAPSVSATTFTPDGIARSNARLQPPPRRSAPREPQARLRWSAARRGSASYRAIRSCTHSTPLAANAAFAVGLARNLMKALPACGDVELVIGAAT